MRADAWLSDLNGGCGRLTGDLALDLDLTRVRPTDLRRATYLSPLSGDKDLTLCRLHCDPAGSAVGVVGVAFWSLFPNVERADSDPSKLICNFDVALHPSFSRALDVQRPAVLGRIDYEQVLTAVHHHFKFSSGPYAAGVGWGKCDFGRCLASHSARSSDRGAFKGVATDFEDQLLRRVGRDCHRRVGRSRMELVRGRA